MPRPALGPLGEPDPFEGHHRHCYIREGAHCSCGHTNPFGLPWPGDEQHPEETPR